MLGESDTQTATLLLASTCHEFVKGAFPTLWTSRSPSIRCVSMGITDDNFNVY